MAVPKFYRVLRGQRGNAAKQKFLDYLEILSPTSEQSKIGTGGNRPDSQILYVEPFNVDLGTELVLQTSALLPAWQAVDGLAPVIARTKAAVPANKTAIKLRSGKAARVRATTGLLGNGVEKTSHLTGLHYLSYGGNSISFPFGRANATDTMGEAFTAIKAAMPTNYKRVGLIEENL